MTSHDVYKQVSRLLEAAVMEREVKMIEQLERQLRNTPSGDPITVTIPTSYGNIPVVRNGSIYGNYALIWFGPGTFDRVYLLDRNQNLSNLERIKTALAKHDGKLFSARPRKVMVHSTHFDLIKSAVDFKAEQAKFSNSLNSPVNATPAKENMPASTSLDVLPEGVSVRKVLLPAGYKSAPTSISDALRRARQVLKDEGRWAKGYEHSVGNYKGATCSVDSKTSDDPFCGSWTACARGAVSLVTRGVVKKETRGWQGNITSIEWVAPDQLAKPLGAKFDANEQAAHAMYKAAEQLLDLAVVANSKDHESTIVGLNDASLTKREQVIEAFDAAIRMADLGLRDLVSNISGVTNHSKHAVKVTG